MAPVFTVVSAAWSIYSSFREQQQANAMLDAQAQQYKYNAKIAQYQADDARERGIIQERQEILKAAAQVGEAETAELGGGEGGAVVGVGSRYDNVEDIAVNGEMMGKLARRNAEMEAWGYERERDVSMYNARVARSQKASTFTMAMNSIFGNTDKIGASWDAFKERPTISTTPQIGFNSTTQAPSSFSGVDYSGLNSGNYYSGASPNAEALRIRGG